MKFVYSNHALEQIKRRNLSQNLVEEVLKSPESIISSGNLKVFQSVIKTEQSKRFLLRVFVNTGKLPATVVTVYKTSKIEKYHEGKI
ncbi:MAG: DUF4258 domain-containing protein [Bacteroidales bacterium]|nr:DUF4258 domain-containing protein [Bacteroidales bacterium]